MKPSSRFLQSAILASIFQASHAEPIVAVQWRIFHTPEAGLQDITFPITLSIPSRDPPQVSGYSFEQKFNFKNQPAQLRGDTELGYVALQPRPDTGSPSIHAVFSSSISGTTSTDNNCKDGADGGAGVTCAVDIDGNLEHGYHLKVKNTGGTTWSGTLIDTVTKSETHIGAYTLPEGSGGILDTQVGTVEYLPTDVCGDLPATEAVFGFPTTESGGAGTLDEPHQDGVCTNFASSEIDKAWEILILGHA